MSSVEIRPFRRSDREQLTELVNVHVDAVVPGRSVSVNAVLSQLEREPGEGDRRPVGDRADDARGRPARAGGRGGAADPLRRGRPRLRLVSRRRRDPLAPLLAAGRGRCRHARRGVHRDDGPLGRQEAMGGRVAPGAVGLRHPGAVAARPRRPRAGRLRARRARGGGPRGPVGDLPRLGSRSRASPSGASSGHYGTAFVALREDEPVGLFELRSDLTNGGALSRLAGWGEVWNLHVDEGLRRRGVGTWLVGHGADWLRLGGVRMLLAEHEAENEVGGAFLRALGFRERPGRSADGRERGDTLRVGAAATRSTSPTTTRSGACRRA